jgi:hypothetical protein
MSEEQRELYLSSNIFPDGFSIEQVLLASRLVRKGKYPWGVSSRVYFDKPGQKNKKRPITIPPFMDKVVQKSIELVLQSIYEPAFEKLNRSFGFRPNKGSHDAIIALTSRKNTGMKTAVEGDIEAAYDTVNKETLLKILGKRIHEKKFIEFIRNRLDYEYIEKETGNRYRPTLGIPQGGIDSPYLFNIYMHELDEYVQNQLQEYVDILNIEKGAISRQRNKYYVKKTREIQKKLKGLTQFKQKIKEAQDPEKIDNSRKELWSEIRTIRLLNQKRRLIYADDKNRMRLNFFYTRYADDWILLTNGSKAIGEMLKNKISTFLKENLQLTLSPIKTLGLFTDITKEPAHFLGFEIRGTGKGAFIKQRIQDPKSKKKNHLIRRSGLPVWAAPDKQRILNKLHMKGVCDKKGFTREIAWLSTLEAHVIIERYNASIRGLAQFYMGFIRNNSMMYRWIYTLRFSCLKTLAQKYKITISKIFKRFGKNMYSASTKTIAVTAQLKIKKRTYEKTWKLLTGKELTTINNRRVITLAQRFWSIENEDSIGDYPIGQGRVPKVTNDDYVEKLSWVTL